MAKEGWLPMHADDPRPECLEDDQVQSAVMALLLAEHPIRFTVGDLVAEIGGEDTVGNAVRDLIAVGLLRREGESVLPTLAALRFDRLPR